jgi:hypothetical protein
MQATPMNTQKIIVIGSANTDMVVKSGKLPFPGETILGGTFLMNAGGKGANQAVAAARLGGDVALIAKLGNDIFGKQTIDGLNKEGINTGHVHLTLLLTIEPKKFFLSISLDILVPYRNICLKPVFVFFYYFFFFISTGLPRNSRNRLSGVSALSCWMSRKIHCQGQRCIC